MNDKPTLLPNKKNFSRSANEVQMFSFNEQPSDSITNFNDAIKIFLESFEYESDFFRRANKLYIITTNTQSSINEQYEALVKKISSWPSTSKVEVESAIASLLKNLFIVNEQLNKTIDESPSLARSDSASSLNISDSENSNDSSAKSVSSATTPQTSPVKTEQMEIKPIDFKEAITLFKKASAKQYSTWLVETLSLYDILANDKLTLDQQYKDLMAHIDTWKVDDVDLALEISNLASNFTLCYHTQKGSKPVAIHKSVIDANVSLKSHSISIENSPLQPLAPKKKRTAKRIFIESGDNPNELVAKPISPSPRKRSIDNHRKNFIDTAHNNSVSVTTEVTTELPHDALRDETTLFKTTDTTSSSAAATFFNNAEHASNTINAVESASSKKEQLATEIESLQQRIHTLKNEITDLQLRIVGGKQQRERCKRSLKERLGKAIDNVKEIIQEKETSFGSRSAKRWWDYIPLVKSIPAVKKAYIKRQTALDGKFAAFKDANKDLYNAKDLLLITQQTPINNTEELKEIAMSLDSSSNQTTNHGIEVSVICTRLNEYLGAHQSITRMQDEQIRCENALDSKEKTLQNKIFALSTADLNNGVQLSGNEPWKLLTPTV